ncbi:MAG TPA: TlpA disulfide reductase family protein [Chitinophagaceae bacterium]|nr:TlpA disulfide reductase family protein [Chitinophagaceae bacterium]
MEKHLLLFAVVFGVSRAQAQISNNHRFNLLQPIEVAGVITHYTPMNGKNFILFRYSDVGGHSKDTSVIIDRSGRFQVRLTQPFEADFGMMYQRRFITLYGAPGDTIKLSIDDDKWAGDGNPFRAMEISGRFASLSERIIDFDYSIGKADLHHERPSVGTPDGEYASTRTQEMHEQLGFLKKYLAEEEIHDAAFIHWCKNKIYYNAGWDIAFKCFSGKLNRSTDYRQLMNFIKDIPLGSPSDMHSSAYYRFIGMLASDFQIITNVNDSVSHVLELQPTRTIPVPLRENKMVAVDNPIVEDPRLPITLSAVDQYTQGFTRQLMYYGILGSSENAKEDVSVYENVITDRTMLQLLNDKRKDIKKPFARYDLSQHIRDYPFNDTAKRRLLQLLEAEKGHYLAMDFWGTWCGPCMMEMHVYHEFIDSLSDKPVKFLFLAIDTDLERANEVKNKYDIPGEFISLTDDEAHILENVMGFSGVPAHFLLNPQDTVISDHIQNGIAAGAGMNKWAVRQMSELIDNRK